MNTFHGGLPRPGKFRHVTAAMFLSAALATSLPGFCGPIHDAARDGDVKKVELLIKNEPNLISSKDEKYGQTPLHVAAFNDRLDVAKLLIEHKADVNAKATNGSTPLHLAAAKGNKDIVELLIENKADVNAVDNDGWSPTHSAVTWGRKDVEDLLSKNGGKDLPAPKPAAAPPAQSAEKAPPKETTKDGQFTAYDDGTVVDTKTNLMWAARDNGTAVSWSGAKSYAKTFRGGNYSDWRLPTESELAALYDKAKTRRTYCQAAVDELGQTADDVHVTETIYLSGTRVWSSQESKPGSVVLYDFHSGSDVTRPGTDNFTDMASRVLLVRAIKR